LEDVNYAWKWFQHRNSDTMTWCLTDLPTTYNTLA
jgi:hypothetical protein